VVIPMRLSRRGADETATIEATPYESADTVRGIGALRVPFVLNTSYFSISIFPMATVAARLPN
jgi:hypothetical protein